MNTPFIKRFTSEEILDELIRRVGPDGAIDEFNRHAADAVSSIDELLQRMTH
jgi:hypothetical protein